MPRTKIVCTIGPASCSPEIMRELIGAGMNVGRINFSHGDHATHARSIATLREVAREEGQLVSVLADLQGPKLRVGVIDDAGLDLKVGDRVSLVAGLRAAADHEIPIPHECLFRDLCPGDRVLFDDGNIELVVIARREGRLLCEMTVGGVLTSRKGINVPGSAIDVAAMTDKDRRDAVFAIEQAVDFLGLSFVRRPADVRELREFLAGHGAQIPIIAKIEKPEALQSFDDILSETDGIMVARGDLGVETPAEEVPFHQKRIIRACNQAGKPVITATQMLQSMITEPRPTRAEASDVVNAILDGTDAVMLSGETAIGQYPGEAARTMAKICTNAEAHLVSTDWVHRISQSREDIAGSISQAAVRIALEVGAKVIVSATMSGSTARMVARFRPPMPVLAVTPHEAVVKRLALSWGVIPVQVPAFESTDDMMYRTARVAAEHGLVQDGDPMVVTAGIPFGTGGRTNMLKVTVAGEDDA